MKLFPMSWIFFNELRRTPVRRYAAIIVLTLLAFTARADDDRHWTTTNHIHRGILQRGPGGSGLDDGAAGGRGYIGQFKLTYSLWSVMDEALDDFIFSWEWQPGNLVVGRGPAGNITSTDLAKYPDLARNFAALKPISVTLATDIEFYNVQGQRYGAGTKTVRPDLIGPAGEKEPMHLTGSPTWENFFQCENHPSANRTAAFTIAGQPAASDNSAAVAPASRNKKLFVEAAHVRLLYPKITAVEWPEGALNLIADEFTRREAAEKKRLEDAKKPAEAKPKTAVKPPGTGPNALERAANGTAKNPLELAAAGQSSRPLNPLERAANGDTKNPLELASQGVRLAPENPLEKTVRLEAVERARLAEIARQAELARQAALAKQAELARRAQAGNSQTKKLPEKYATVAQQDPVIIYVVATAGLSIRRQLFLGSGAGHSGDEAAANAAVRNSTPAVTGPCRISLRNENSIQLNVTDAGEVLNLADLVGSEQLKSFQDPIYKQLLEPFRSQVDVGWDCYYTTASSKVTYFITEEDAQKKVRDYGGSHREITFPSL